MANAGAHKSALEIAKPGVTIRDVANRAGVSIGTVSRALKNQNGLGEDTRQQVLRSALELGYDTSNLRLTKLRRVSFVTSRLPDLPANPFYSHVLHGVEAACRDGEIVLSIAGLRPSDRAAEIVRRHEADALICVGYFEPKLLERIAGIGLPVVLIDHFQDGFASVNIDNFGGAQLAMRHLIASGRRRIAFISGPAHYSVGQRLRGFRQTLFEAGVPADPALEVQQLPVSQREGTVAAIEQLLALPKTPDAIFTWNDECALFAMRTCLELGLRVPEDIAIVGFDDIDAAAHNHPTLTTVRVDKELLGRRGLDVLLERRFDAADVIPVELIVRESA